MTFSDRLDILLKERGINQKQLIEDLGIGKNNFANWKKKGTNPNGATLEKLASYFGVSTDYLLGLTAEDKVKEVPRTHRATQAQRPSHMGLTHHEIELIHAYRSLDNEGRTMVDSALIRELRRIRSKPQDEPQESLAGLSM